MTQIPVFCSIVPPHILDKLAHDGHESALRTLEADAGLRTRRRVTGVRGGAAAGTPTGKPKRTIYDAGHREALPGRKVHAEGDAPSKDATVNRAHAGLGATFDLFLNVYGHDSVDGSGLPLDATVHFGVDYANAFWDGSQMVFGDGDGDLFLDFTIPVDVIGHELAHGFTQYTANLEYYGQSGALNESVSDVFGSLVKQYALGQTAEQADWLIGAGLLGPGVDRGEALRSMKEPGTAYDDDVLGKDPQPAHMDDYVRTSRDNGGVHINSGIPNRAFHLLATELGGNAWERAGQIWFDVMTGGALAPETRFSEFAAATVAAAKARYGAGAEVQAVTKAWEGVGVPTD
ncbi:M4 family metallopeptidase [Streptomyces sp. NRRL F-5727]|uniref:M4 family metallopeptidase n=1 Tax=Streptomyces sp. NRRL F-5727 TaxID=1463871 RepID=UPI0004CC0CB5|nr:M4 family metallopeptidase [Streptomyces sp. NRRL F-5727]